LTFTGVGVGLSAVGIVGGFLSDETGFIFLPFIPIDAQIQVNAPPPIPVCPQAQVVCNDAGACTAAVAFVLPTEPPNLVSVLCARSDQLSLNDPYPLGVTTITCTGTDAAGASGICSTTITVNDCESPRIACPPNITVAAGAACSAVVAYETPSATDNCGASVSIACHPPSGSTFTTGQTPVTCTAIDSSGNMDSCAFTVTVQAANLRISQSAVSGQAKPGQTLLYTITVANLGPAAATGVAVIGAVPEGTTFLGAEPAGIYAAPAVGGSGPVRWDVGTLSSGASATLKLNVIVTARGNDLITNTATVESGTCESKSADNSTTLTSKRRTRLALSEP
jgi:uncharacterized repeat protein (TIGR01451 family)